MTQLAMVYNGTLVESKPVDFTPEAIITALGCDPATSYASTPPDTITIYHENPETLKLALNKIRFDSPVRVKVAGPNIIFSRRRSE